MGGIFICIVLAVLQILRQRSEALAREQAALEAQRWGVHSFSMTSLAVGLC
jgi:hypothetical protein